MKLLDDSLGITDALTYHRCPMQFHAGLKRFTEGERLKMMAGHYSEPLAYGQALHTAAEAFVKNPDIYLDDAVDAGWAEWSHLLEPRNHAELKADVATLIARTAEAPNLKLVCAEQDMKVPLFVGEPREGSDEEHTWYYYRFKIDALYHDESNPGHYVVRDFKSYRRRKWQDDVDDDDQMTAYVFGIMEWLGDQCNSVTIWLDQVKHENAELFTYRTEADLIRWKEWMTSTMRAILAKPEEEIAGLPILNEYCSWCPLLTQCGILDVILDYDASIIAEHNAAYDADRAGAEAAGRAIPFEQYVEKYERAKQAMKALKAFTDQVSDDLKWTPGTYGGREYEAIEIEQNKIPADKAVEVLGVESLKDWPALPMNVKDRFPAYAEQLDAVKSPSYGYHRLNSRKAGSKPRKAKESAS